MNSVSLISLFLVTLSGILFLYYAAKSKEKRLTINGYLVSNRDVSGKAFMNTFTAASLSLACNLIFFIEAHKAYGWLMGLAPMFFIMTQMIFLKMIKKSSIDLNKIRTLSDLWYEVFPSKLIARTISIVLAITTLIIVFIEISLGSIIISILLPDSSFYKAATFFSLGALVTAYVYYGGYKAIIKTDHFQLLLIIIASLALFFFALTSPVLNGKDLGNVVTGLFQYSEKGIELATFMLWVCVVNVCACLTDITGWQRIVASKSVHEASIGLQKGLWKALLIFWAPVFSFILLYSKGHNFDSVSSFLSVVYSQSGALVYIIYPLIVVGFAAALFSTADTLLMAAVYSVCDQNTLLPKLQQLSSENKDHAIRKVISFIFIGLFASLSVIYYIQESNIASQIMPILYASWGYTIFAPLPVIALYRLQKKLPPFSITKANEIILLAFILIGILIIIIGSVWQDQTGLQFYSQAAFAIACVTMWTGLWIALNYPIIHPKRQLKRTT